MWNPEALLRHCRELLRGKGLVRVDAVRARHLAHAAPDDLLEPPTWRGAGMLEGSEAELVAWLLAYNAINYAYWPESREPRWWVRLEGQDFGRDDEALGVMAAFAQAIRRGVPLHDGDWLARLQRPDLDDILAPAPGAGALPRMEQRLAGLRELGRAYRAVGGPVGLVRGSGTAVELVQRLVTSMPTWNDRRSLGGHPLPFHKRAQLTVAMIHSRLGGQGLGRIAGMDRLTAFADYRLPQVLRAEGVLRLAPELRVRIDKREPLPADTPSEVLIRAATVHAAELIRQALQGRRPQVTALVVDHLLWRTAVRRADTLPPFHRTPTTDY